MTATRPHLAILGAGPTGLEAALAAAERGLPFTLYEAAAVGGNVRSWGHVRLFSPWRLDVSPRARAALAAAGAEPPDGDACPTGHELCNRVLDPLAALPAIAPHLRTGVRVLAIGREGLLKQEEIASPERASRPFRLLVRDAGGGEGLVRADAVLDCTGTWGHPNALGDGGIPAPGERELASAIRHDIPDLAAEGDAWAGKTVLLVGAGHSAQTAAVALAELTGAAPETRVLWALRSPHPKWAIDPSDPLPERRRLTAHAAEIAAGAAPGVEAVLGVVVDRLAAAGERVAVVLRARDGSETRVEVDRILALTGAAGDHTLYRQLQVHECYATSGPMRLAAALLGSTSTDCLDQESHGADTLVNPEPGFFLLGAKSYGRNTSFLMRVGWQQVDDVLGLLAAAHRP